MPDFYHIENDFLQTVIHVIEENLGDENFGVSELADQVNMSRSNLLRKVKKLTDLSVSVLIRQVRLEKSRELLKDKSYTISEISFKVGFNSTSYFIKCFREQYGYPPGEETKLGIESREPESAIVENKESVQSVILTGLFVLLLIGTVFWVKENKTSRQSLEKSIAVLPFKNDSDDSSNIYIINGLMEAVLNDLQKIQDLRVVSRTSVEKYRHQPKTIPEISRELNVSYFVEGSGQKIGDQILLTIQLIEAERDKHLWSKRYIRQTDNIFNLQSEVAQDIAQEIEVIITPEEQQLIEKAPTENPVAYDFYLQGVQFANEQTLTGLDSAIRYFKKAINEDQKFAHAYAFVAICYYYSDLFQRDKKYGEEINTYADRAILLDAELSISQIAKAFFYMQDAQYELAVQYFEKSLEYNPNSSWASNALSDIFTNYIPNTKKYLTYALRGSKLNLGGDSVAASFTYLHLSNALIQNGFIKEAENHIEQSLSYHPDNIFSQYLRAYILLAKNENLAETKSLLLETLQKDTTRIDVIQEVAKTCYAMEDYEEAFSYYQKFLKIKDSLNLDIFQAEDLKIGFVLDQLGHQKEAQNFYAQFREFADRDKSIYKDLHLAAFYAANHNVELGIKHLKGFSEQENYMYWFIYMQEDPIMRSLAEHPDFEPTVDKIIAKFWAEHEQIKEILVKENLL